MLACIPSGLVVYPVACARFASLTKIGTVDLSAGSPSNTMSLCHWLVDEVTWVSCGQMAEWIEMPLGTGIGLGQGSRLHPGLCSRVGMQPCTDTDTRRYRHLQCITYVYVVIATKPVDRLQICPTVHS